MNSDNLAPTDYLSGFSHALRQEGLNITAYHTSTFLTASHFIHLEQLDELYWTGRATLLEHVDDVPVFDTVFRDYFLFQGNKILALGGQKKEKIEDDDSLSIEGISQNLEEDVIKPERGDKSRKQASPNETLKSEYFSPPDETETVYIQKIISLVNKLHPTKQIRRYRPHKKGKLPDLRSSMQQLPRTDGEMIRILRRKKSISKKSIVVLIDISGSMALYVRSYLLFSYALLQAKTNLECFCIGTRLTRVTDALKNREINAALKNISTTVLDWRGGTRLGDGVHAFLADANNFTLVRGAEVFILSDGLERGEPGKLINGVRRLAQNADKVHWISPLAGGTDYIPATRAMQVIAPIVGSVSPGMDLLELYTSLRKVWRPSAH